MTQFDDFCHIQRFAQKKREEVLGSNKSFKDVDYNDW